MTQPSGPERKSRIDHYKQLAEASSLGWMFPIAIALGYGAGYWLDRFFGTKPWLTLIFIGFGIIAAFLNLFRTAMKDAMNEAGQDESSDGSGKPG